MKSHTMPMQARRGTLKCQHWKPQNLGWAEGNAPVPTLGQEGRRPQCHLVWEQRGRLVQPHATCAMVFGHGLFTGRQCL